MSLSDFPEELKQSIGKKKAPLKRGLGIRRKKQPKLLLYGYGINLTQAPVSAHVFNASVTNAAVCRDTNHVEFSLRLAKERAIRKVRTDEITAVPPLGLNPEGRPLGRPFFVPAIVTGTA